MAERLSAGLVQPALLTQPQREDQFFQTPTAEPKASDKCASTARQSTLLRSRTDRNSCTAAKTTTLFFRLLDTCSSRQIYRDLRRSPTPCEKWRLTRMAGDLRAVRAKPCCAMWSPRRIVARVGTGNADLFVNQAGKLVLAGYFFASRNASIALPISCVRFTLCWI